MAPPFRGGLIMSSHPLLRSAVRAGMVLLLWSVAGTLLIGLSVAQTGTEFSGTVLSADPATGKLAVKKEDGGTRFTFVATDKTKFEGAGLKGLAELKKGDRVTVTYIVTGSQYVAQKVSRK
jgi:hypothetical protein